MGKILVVGATSDIAYSLSRLFAKNQDELVLAGRNEKELDRIKKEFEDTYKAKVQTTELDVTNQESVARFKKNIDEMELKGVVFAYGYLGEQEKGQIEEKERKLILTVNLNSVVDIAEECAKKLEKQKDGFICAISSVAGDRGRQSNYLYGAAKGGLSIYLQGLRNRLAHSNVHVLTVKPGFVYTKMTEDILKKTWMVSMPEKVARDIYKGIKKKKNVIYTPFFWRLIMMVIKSIPEFIFKKMKM